MENVIQQGRLGDSVLFQGFEPRFSTVLPGHATHMEEWMHPDRSLSVARDAHSVLEDVS